MRKSKLDVYFIFMAREQEVYVSQNKPGKGMKEKQQKFYLLWKQ